MSGWPASPMLLPKSPCPATPTPKARTSALCPDWPPACCSASTSIQATAIRSSSSRPPTGFLEALKLKGVGKLSGVDRRDLGGRDPNPTDPGLADGEGAGRG